MSELLTSLEATYFQQALVQAVVVGIVGGVVGTHVVLRRLPFFVAALSHATFPGVVIAAALGLSVGIGAAVAALVVAAIVARSIDSGIHQTNVVAVALGAAFALGIVLLGLTGASSGQAAEYLVGSVLTVTQTEVVVSALFAAMLIVAVVALRRPLTQSAFDPVAFAALGHHRLRYDYFLLAATALAVVLMIPVVGTLLPLSLLVVPAATARLWTQRLSWLSILSPVLAVVASVGGVLASAAFGVSAGGAVAMLAGVLFVVSWAIQAGAMSVRSRRSTPESLPTSTSVA